MKTENHWTFICFWSVKSNIRCGIITENGRLLAYFSAIIILQTHPQKAELIITMNKYHLTLDKCPADFKGKQ